MQPILQVGRICKSHEKEWSNQLPLRRPHEFILLNYLLHHPEVNHL